MNTEDCFKPLFKYYKQKAVKPSFEDVVDFNDCSLKTVSSTFYDVSLDNNALGLKSIGQWKIHQYNEVPGLYFISNPFKDEGIDMWIKRCLEYYCCPPHKTNLPCDSDSIWSETCAKIQSSAVDLNRNIDQLKVLKTSPVWKLRWSTLGMHHDWNSKVYSQDQCSKFPTQLNSLSKLFAHAIGWTDYDSQAAIVNYYHVGSTLSPHTDHSEQDLSKPLISISFGLSAIFLIGGNDKSVAPTAFFIHSGDVLIMSGASRLAYHAVPRILESDSDCFRNDPIEIFKAHSRININVRQFQG